MKVAACTLVLAGCFSKPGPPGMAIDAPPLDAPPDAGMQRHEINWAADGTGATVTGEFFTVHFSNRAGGFHFPDSIRINGVEHLGQDDLLTCRAENAVGMAIYPAHRIAAYTGAVIGSNNLVAPRMRGPAAVQLEVIWSTSFTADVTGMFPWTSMRSPSGVSIYTMFPDGRIVRYDTMIDASSDTVDTTSMDCIPVAAQLGTTRPASPRSLILRAPRSSSSVRPRRACPLRRV